MNTLHNGGGDGKSLAYGGLTHRRPPSPDLYKTRKGHRSSESSEAGSAHGSEYSGLYVENWSFGRQMSCSKVHPFSLLLQSLCSNLMLFFFSGKGHYVH